MWDQVAQFSPAAFSHANFFPLQYFFHLWMVFSKETGIILGASLGVACSCWQLFGWCSCTSAAALLFQAALRVKFPHSSPFVIICWTIKASREPELQNDILDTTGESLFGRIWNCSQSGNSNYEKSRGDFSSIYPFPPP